MKCKPDLFQFYSHEFDVMNYRVHRCCVRVSQWFPNLFCLLPPFHKNITQHSLDFFKNLIAIKQKDICINVYTFSVKYSKKVKIKNTLKSEIMKLFTELRIKR